MLQNVKNIVFLVRAVSYRFRGVRTANIGVIMVSISGRQQQLTNTTKARFLERAFCYLPVLYALAPSARRRAARKPTARNGALGAALAAPERRNPLYLTGGYKSE